jgi:hypothetical protein
MLTDSLLAAIKGAIPIRHLPKQMAHLRRHLCDSPRKRRRRTLDSLTTFASAISA